MYSVSKSYSKERRKGISSDQDRFDKELVCFVLIFITPKGRFREAVSSLEHTVAIYCQKTHATASSHSHSICLFALSLCPEGLPALHCLKLLQM